MFTIEFKTEIAAVKYEAIRTLITRHQSENPNSQHSAQALAWTQRI